MDYNEKTSLKDVDELLSWVVEGDIIEVPISESEEESNWAVFVGKGQVVHVDRINSQVSQSTLRMFCGNSSSSLGRVNNFDHLGGRICKRPLEIVKCAQKQVGKVTNVSPKDFVESCRFDEESGTSEVKGRNYMMT